MYRSEVIPSNKRRMNDWDYSKPRIYMLTLVTEGRQPVFGTLTGDTSLTAPAANAPRLVPSPLGQAVLQEVDGIPGYYPQIRIIARQLMPDHLHMLLYVTTPLPVHLGKVVAGFKAGCNRRWREAQQGGREGTRQGTLERTQRQNRWAPNNGAPDNGAPDSWAPNKGATEETQRQNRWAPDNGAPDNGATDNGATDKGAPGTGCSVPGGFAARTPARTPASTPAAATAKSGLLWEHGYHDRVLSGEGQLQRLVDYIHDNPRRSLVKRQHGEWYRLTTVTAAGTVFQAMGNRQLLQAPRRQAVRCSNRITAEQAASEEEQYLAAARQGTVLISPFISNGERRVEDNALQEHLPIIKLLTNGMEPCYKPQGRYFEACAEGRLLLLSCYPYTTQKITLTRSMCNHLNVLACRLSE